MKLKVFKMKSEDIWEIAKFTLNIVSENYKEEPWDCIIDNDERAIYEILNKYTKDKDEQNKIYGAFLHCQYLDCDKDIYGYVPRVINRLKKLGYKIIQEVFQLKENSIKNERSSIEEDIKIALDKFSDNKDIDSAILIVEKFILGNYILRGGRKNIVKDSLRYILSVIKEY